MIWLIFLIFFISRVVPYIVNPVPFGYDAGLYLSVFKTFPFLAQWHQIGFAPGLFTLTYPLIKLGINPELLLIPLAVISECLLFYSLFWVVKKLTDKKTALIGIFLLTVSAVQFRAYWYFYINNIISLALLILTLYFLSKNRFILGLLGSILIGLFHLPTFLILFLIIVGEILFNHKLRKFYLKLLLSIILVACTYYWPRLNLTIKPYILPIIQSFNIKEIILNTQKGSGAFYNLTTSLMLVSFYLPFAVYGLFSLWGKSKKELRLFKVGFFLILGLIITRFFFYSRFFIMWDIFIIFWAAVGLNKLMEKQKQHKDLFKYYFFILVIFIVAFIFKTGQPLISKDLLKEIKQFKGDSQANILSIESGDTAWLIGYTNYPIIAWGWEGGNNLYWTNEQWRQFYNSSLTEDRIKLIKLLPQPLYIFINDHNLINLIDLQQTSCIEQVSLHFFKFLCPEKKS